MNEGFSLMEFLVSMTIALLLLTLIVSQASLLGQRSVKIIDAQDRLEALFNAVDFFKSDVNSCGKRLQEAQAFVTTPFLETAPHKLTIRYGTIAESLSQMAQARDIILTPMSTEFFLPGKEVLIYDPDSHLFEILRIKEKDKKKVRLEHPLVNDYAQGSQVVVVKTICYQHDPVKQVLSRKIDRSSFQPLLEQVKDFYVSFFPKSASLLYQLELCSGEQVRGYISLCNLVSP